MSAESGEVPLHQESLSSTALDGARIGTFVAFNLIAADQSLSPAHKARLLQLLELAGSALDQAREEFPVIITSLHSTGGLVRP